MKTGGSSSEGQTSLQRLWSFLMKLKNDGVKGQRVRLHVSSDRPLHKRDTIHANVDAFFFFLQTTSIYVYIFTFNILLYSIFFFPFFTLNPLDDTFSQPSACQTVLTSMTLSHCKSASSPAIDTICGGPGGSKVSSRT